MQNINDYFLNNFPRKIFDQEGCLHIFNIGFEERCLGYTKFIADKISTRHKYVCLTTNNDNLTDFLVDMKEENRSEIERLFSNLEIKNIFEIEQVIRQAIPRFKNVFLDISTLPRSYIFKLINFLSEIGIHETKVFLIYTFPKDYVHDKLQQKSPEIESFSQRVLYNNDLNPLVYVLPGFDVEDINIALAYLNGRFHQNKMEQKWLIPFPGRFYNFYERSLESNLLYLKDVQSILFPLEEVNLAFQVLKHEVSSVDKNRPIIFLPLGCRLTCVPIILAVNHLKTLGFTELDIISPKTKEYNSLRSSSYSEPLIENITQMLNK